MNAKTILVAKMPSAQTQSEVLYAIASTNIPVIPSAVVQILMSVQRWKNLVVHTRFVKTKCPATNVSVPKALLENPMLILPASKWMLVYNVPAILIALTMLNV